MRVPAAGGGRLGQPGRHLQPLQRPGHLPGHLHVRCLETLFTGQWSIVYQLFLTLP